MGYAPAYFSDHVAKWMCDGWLPKGGRLIDFGAQEFHGDPDEARERTREFLASRGMSETEIVEAIGRRGKLEVASVYHAIGIDYVAIDVDGSHGSTFFDLNTFAPPPEWIGAFDMINNEGTIEHLVNPINGFQVAHEFLKVGGVARHSMPLSGWSDHGLFHPTSGFYEAMLNENRYELLESRGEVRERQYSDRLFSFDAPIPDVWAHVIFRKQINDQFRPPADHLQSFGAGAVAARLSGNWNSFAAQRFNGETPPPSASFDPWRSFLYTRRWFRSMRNR
jgi:hypothetical protein